MGSVPNWLQRLTVEKFFTRCSIHESIKKNEKNILCLDCCSSICPHCLSHHHTHRLLQIRRYMYNDVIRLGDAEKWMNCSLVQPYTTNRSKVVFLKQRLTSRPIKSIGNSCITCDRSLQDPYLFCSLSCKVHHLLLINKGETMENSWNCCEFSVMADKSIGKSESSQEIEEDSQITPVSVLESPTSSCTLSESVGRKSQANCRVIAATEFKKRRSSVYLKPRPQIWCGSKCIPATELASSVNRRKGIPHRSPLS